MRPDQQTFFRRSEQLQGDREVFKLNECMGKLTKNPFEPICYKHLEALRYLLSMLKSLASQPAVYGDKQQTSTWRTIRSYFEGKSQLARLELNSASPSRAPTDALYNQAVADYESAKPVLATGAALLTDAGLSSFQKLFAALIVFESRKAANDSCKILDLLLNCVVTEFTRAEHQESAAKVMGAVAPVNIEPASVAKKAPSLFSAKSNLNDAAQKHVQRMERARNYQMVTNAVKNKNVACVLNRRPWPFDH